jgi:hypothetical protein
MIVVGADVPISTNGYQEDAAKTAALNAQALSNREEMFLPRLAQAGVSIAMVPFCAFGPTVGLVDTELSLVAYVMAAWVLSVLAGFNLRCCRHLGPGDFASARRGSARVGEPSSSGGANAA